MFLFETYNYWCVKIYPSALIFYYIGRINSLYKDDMLKPLKEIVLEDVKANIRKE
jgi:hypothetical protein